MPSRYTKPRRHSRYRPICRSDPRNKYLRRNGRRWQVRIPLDGSGKLRLDLGYFPTEELARYARHQLLKQLGVSVDDELPTIYAAAREWLGRKEN